MMSELWPLLSKKPKYFIWTATRNDVFDDSTMRKIACRFVRETPLADGRKVWDLLTDERSREVVIVAEKYSDGLATKEDLEAARAASEAAWAASEAAWAAAWDAQAKIILEYPNPFLDNTDAAD